MGLVLIFVVSVEPFVDGIRARVGGGGAPMSRSQSHTAPFASAGGASSTRRGVSRHLLYGWHDPAVAATAVAGGGGGGIFCGDISVQRFFAVFYC